MKPGDKVILKDKECLAYRWFKDQVGVIEEPSTDFFVSVRFKEGRYKDSPHGFFVEQLELV